MANDAGRPPVGAGGDGVADGDGDGETEGDGDSAAGAPSTADAGATARRNARVATSRAGSTRTARVVGDSSARGRTGMGDSLPCRRAPCHGPDRSSGPGTDGPGTLRRDDPADLPRPRRLRDGGLDGAPRQGPAEARLRGVRA